MEFNGIGAENGIWWHEKTILNCWMCGRRILLSAILVVKNSLLWRKRFGSVLMC